MRTIDDFLAHFRRQREWTRRMIGAIPEERFSWAPIEGAFSCGDLVRHLMQAEVFWCRLLVRAAAGEALDPFQLEGEAEQRMRAFRGRNLETSHDDRCGKTFAGCLERWEEIGRRTEGELRALEDAALSDVEVDHPLTTLRAPLWEMLLVMLEHEAHHRGQLSAYLKVLGLPQPAAGVGSP